MRIRFLVLGATLACARVADAQSVGKMLEDDVTHAAKDILAVWSSPFDAKGRDWLIAGASFAAFGASMFADKGVSNWAIRNEGSDLFRAIKPFRRGGWLFSGKTVIPPVAAVYVLGIAFKNQDMRDFVTGCLSGYAAQSYVRKAAASAFGRARPDTTDTPDVSPNDPQIWKLGGGWGNWNMRSFPGGHFANAVTCATYWNERFRLGVAGPVLYAVAAAVGVGRTADDAHWFSDHVIGGILGYAIGREVANRSLRRARGLPHAPVFGVSQTSNGVGVNFNWTF
jgi:membrane-associated phospholipid phosphatase